MGERGQSRLDLANNEWMDGCGWHARMDEDVMGCLIWEISSLAAGWAGLDWWGAGIERALIRRPTSPVACRRLYCRWPASASQGWRGQWAPNLDDSEATPGSQGLSRARLVHN
jgi:hypothetical protein